DESPFAQIAARLVRHPALVLAPFALGIGQLPNAVALSADFRRLPRVQPPRVHDGGIGSPGEPLAHATHDIPVRLDVRAPRTVACLARDAEFRRVGVDVRLVERLAPWRPGESRLAVRRMAADADRAPVARL